MPSYLAYWNTDDPTIAGASWNNGQLGLLAADGNNDTFIQFNPLVDQPASEPLTSGIIYPQQWGPQIAVFVTGIVDEVTPLPSALSLFATGLGLMGLLGLGRRRRAQTTL